MDKVAGITPDQQSGSATNSQHTVSLSSPGEASRFFELAKSRLQDVNRWQQLCGEASAVFTLTDGNGQEVNRRVQKGDYFKIDIPGPGNKAGDGYDWVRVEEIEDTNNPEKELFAIRVRPAPNPQTTEEDTAHFFKSDATSSFAVVRQGNDVMASVQGRNEKPNSDNDNLIDKARNVLVAVGAVLGFSNPQWKSLVTGLLKEE